MRASSRRPRWSPEGDVARNPFLRSSLAMSTCAIRPGTTGAKASGSYNRGVLGGFEHDVHRNDIPSITIVVFTAASTRPVGDVAWEAAPLLARSNTSSSSETSVLEESPRLLWPGDASRLAIRLGVPRCKKGSSGRRREWGRCWTPSASNSVDEPWACMATWSRKVLRSTGSATRPQPGSTGTCGESSKEPSIMPPTAPRTRRPTTKRAPSARPWSIAATSSASATPKPPAATVSARHCGRSEADTADMRSVNRAASCGGRKFTNSEPSTLRPKNASCAGLVPNRTRPSESRITKSHERNGTSKLPWRSRAQRLRSSRSRSYVLQAAKVNGNKSITNRSEPPSWSSKAPAQTVSPKEQSAQTGTTNHETKRTGTSVANPIATAMVLTAVTPVARPAEAVQVPESSEAGTPNMTLQCQGVVQGAATQTRAAEMTLTISHLTWLGRFDNHASERTTHIATCAMTMLPKSTKLRKRKSLHSKAKGRCSASASTTPVHTRIPARVSAAAQ
mmetsp:Transcript_73838/g.207346  ORF Transcript_73838/g.207346 Transcript_73838/m.207346 type:complete len:506 (-) Transcript_73838:179-1696(-)